MSVIYAIWRSIRPLNCALASAGLLVGAYLTLEPIVWSQVLPGAIAVFCVCAAGNVINDLRDIEIDKVAHPDRPLAAGELAPRVAFWAGMTLNGIGFIAPVFSNIECAIIVWSGISLLYAYNYSLKRLPLISNLIVAVLGGCVFIAGGLALAPDITFELPGPLIGALFAFLMHLMREIVKDIQDADADRRHGISTLSMILGARVSLAIVAVLAIILGFAVWWPYRVEWFGGDYMLVAGIGVLIPVIAATTLALVRPATFSIRALAITLKLSMVAGLIALIIA